MPPIVYTYDMEMQHLHLHDENVDDHGRYHELKEHYKVHMQ